MLKIAVLLITILNQGMGIDYQRFFEDGKVGLKDNSGNIVLPAQYQSLGWSDGSLSLSGNLIGFQENDHWGLLNLNNEKITPAVYVSLAPLGSEYFEAAVIQKLSVFPKKGVINTSGKVVISFNYESLQYDGNRFIATQRSRDGFAYGLLDIQEKVVIPIRYLRITPIGTLRYAVENDKKKMALFADTGRQITGFDIDSISGFKSNKAIIYKDLLRGLINRQGDIMEQADFREIKIHDDGTYSVQTQHKWKVLNNINETILEIKADSVTALSKDLYSVSKSGYHQLRDANFSIADSAWYSSISELYDGMMIVGYKNKFGLLDYQAKPKTAFIYDSLLFLRGLIAVKRRFYNQLLWTICDYDGKQKSDHFYEKIATYDEQYLITSYKNYKGILSVSGKEIFPCIYNEIVQIRDNTVSVKFHNQYGILNLNGDWLVGPMNYPLYILKDKLFLEYQDDITYMKSYDGDIIYFSKNPLQDEGDYLLENWPDGKMWKIDLSGRIFAKQGDSPSLLFEALYAPSEGFYGIKKDGRFGFVDDQNRLRIANRYEGIGSFKGGLAPVMIRNKWGFIDMRENIVIQPQFDFAEDFYKDISIVQRGGKFGLIDRSGNFIIQLSYEEIKRLSNDNYLIRKNEDYGLAAPNGKIIINPGYDALEDLGNGFATVKRSGKYGLINMEGFASIPLIYESLSYNKLNDRYFAGTQSVWIKKDRP